MDSYWLRMGDAGEYESFEELHDMIAAIDRYLCESGPRHVELFSSGIQIVPQFTGYNYISCYWGDDDANLIRVLDSGEFEELRTSLIG